MEVYINEEEVIIDNLELFYIFLCSSFFLIILLNDIICIFILIR